MFITRDSNFAISLTEAKPAGAGFASFRLLTPLFSAVRDGAGVGGRSLGTLVVRPVGGRHVGEADVARGLVRAAAEDGVDDLHGFGAGHVRFGVEAAVRVADDVGGVVDLHGCLAGRGDNNSVERLTADGADAVFAAGLGRGRGFINDPVARLVAGGGV